MLTNFINFKNEKKYDKIYVETPNGNDFFTKNLHFNLFYIQRLDVNESSVQIESIEDSVEIADCIFFDRAEKHAVFEIISWRKSKSYQDIISKLKSNQELGVLKPFIKLKDDPIADKCSSSELDNLVKTVSKLEKLIEED